MKFRWLQIVCIVCLSGFTCQADVVNGSFDSPVIYDASSINVSSDSDQGWHAYASSYYTVSSYNDLEIDGLMESSGYWFGQIYTDDYFTYGNGVLSFDVTLWPRGITGAMFEFEIYGTDSTDMTDTALLLNADSSVAGSAWTFLDSGYESVSNIGSHQTSLTFGSTAYKYLGVRFRFTGSNPSDANYAVDNISVVPEPAAAMLVGLGGFVALIGSRIFRGLHRKPNDDVA